MPLVQVKCTNCGANLEIDNTLDAAGLPLLQRAVCCGKGHQ